MPSNYLKDDPTYGQIDLDEEFITESWLIDKYVGGTLFTWGYNSYGEVGNGTAGSNYYSPVQIGNLTNWKQISSSISHKAAIKTDGTLWTWGGYNSYYGHLGNGTTAFYSSPIQIGSLTNWKEVSCGYYSTAAIKTDGTLWTWGYNYYGQLGNGSTLPFYSGVSTPIQIGSLTNWKHVSGNNSSYGVFYAIKTDGTLWAWGYYIQGYPGSSSPVQVGTDKDWRYINKDLAIKTDNSLWLINNGQTAFQTYGTSQDWKQVSTAGNYWLGIKTDGTLWAYGYNVQGQLGNGTTITSTSPIQVGSSTNWKQVEVGSSQTVAAIKTDGTLWTWGLGLYGELGNNANSYSSPIQVGLLTNWKRVSSIGYGIAAITFADIT